MPYFIEELNDNVVTFLHYLDFYKKIYDLSDDEKPQEEIIQNPVLCDEWLRVYISKMKQKQRQINHSSGKSKSKVERESYSFN